MAITKKEFLALPMEERRRLLRESAERAAECEKCSMPNCTWCPNYNPNKPEQVDTSGLSAKKLDTSEKPEQLITCVTCDCNRTKSGCAGMPDLPLEKCWKPIKPVPNHPESTVLNTPLTARELAIKIAQDAHTRHSIARELEEIRGKPSVMLLKSNGKIVPH